MHRSIAFTLAVLGGAELARGAACADGDSGTCDAGPDDLAMMQLRKNEKARLKAEERRQPALPRCEVGDHVQCLGTTGNMCAGDQCCPSVSGSGTYPCPSAHSNFTRCENPEKIVNCLAQPRSDRFKGLNSKPFLRTHELTGTSEELGKIYINEDGVLNEYWLPGAVTLDDYMTVQYTPPYRYYLMKSYTTDYSNPDNYYMPNLIGKTFSVDFVFGEDGPGCGCNLNFYLVNGPVSDAGKDGDYYCDAQCFEGLGCCEEFDMNEGNMFTQQVTNHACTKDYADHPDWVCNKWGDPEVKSTQAEFSPGSSYTIDSRNTFTYEQEFTRDENGDAIVYTRMIQGDNTVTMTMGPSSSQLNAMFEVIEGGMVFVTGYWYASDMNWLDGAECGSGAETCNKQPAYLTNWKITTNSSPTPTASPTPAPTPSPYSTGFCCWSASGSCGCTEDTSITGWCDESESNCNGCGGGVWCH